MIQKTSYHMLGIKNQSYLMILLKNCGLSGMKQIPILVQYQKLHLKQWQSETLSGKSLMTPNVIRIVTQLYYL